MNAIFVLNDEEHLADELRRRFAHRNIEVYHARYVDEGIQLAHDVARRTRYVLAFVDMMLPTSESSFARHQTVLQEREQLVGGILSRRKRKKPDLERLAEIDSRISSELSQFGGILFFEAVEEVAQNWRVVVYSACSPESIRPMIPRGIQIHQFVMLPCYPGHLFEMVEGFILNSKST